MSEYAPGTRPETTAPRQPAGAGRRGTGRTSAWDRLGPPGCREIRQVNAGRSVSLGDLGQHVTCGQEQVLLAAVLDLGAAVLGVDDDIAFNDINRNPLTVVVVTTRSDGQDLALLGLLLGGVGDDDAGRGRRLGLIGLNEDLVLERLDVHARHG